MFTILTHFMFFSSLLDFCSPSAFFPFNASVVGYKEGPCQEDPASAGCQWATFYRDQRSQIRGRRPCGGWTGAKCCYLSPSYSRQVWPDQMCRGLSFYNTVTPCPSQELRSEGIPNTETKCVALRGPPSKRSAWRERVPSVSRSSREIRVQNLMKRS